MLQEQSGGGLASRQPQHSKKLVDSGGGFFLEEDEEEEAEGERQSRDLPAPMLGLDRPDCTLCQNPFSDSYLFRQLFFYVLAESSLCVCSLEFAEKANIPCRYRYYS